MLTISGPDRLGWIDSLTISGPDRLDWIDSLTSQSVARLTPGESSETLLLDGNGRIEYAVRLIDDGVVLRLLLEREEAGGLLARLSSIRFMLRVERADRSADFATVGTLGHCCAPAAARCAATVFRNIGR